MSSPSASDESGGGAICDDGPSVVVLDLRPPEGRMVATACIHELRCFVSSTLAVVPFGAESAQLDLDRLVSDLLADNPQAH